MSLMGANKFCTKNEQRGSDVKIIETRSVDVEVNFLDCALLQLKHTNTLPIAVKHL